MFSVLVSIPATLRPRLVVERWRKRSPTSPNWPATSVAPEPAGRRHHGGRHQPQPSQHLRGRPGPAGNKDDRFDAFVLASKFWRSISMPQREHQVGRFPRRLEERLARRAHLRTHRQAAAKVEHLARAGGYGKESLVGGRPRESHLLDYRRSSTNKVDLGPPRDGRLPGTLDQSPCYTKPRPGSARRDIVVSSDEPLGTGGWRDAQ